MSNKYAICSEGKSILLGVKVGEKNDKTTLKFQNGKIRHIITGKIISVFEMDNQDQAEILQILETKAAEADLPVLFELLENGKEYTIEEIASLLYDNCNAFHTAATYIALKKDNIYFRERNRCFLVNKLDEVELKLKQEELKQQSSEKKHKMREDSFLWLKENFSDIKDSIPPYVLTFLEPIKNYAIFGEEYKNRDEAKKLLKSLKNAIPEAGIRSDAIYAFEFCVKMKIFNQHENLAVYRFNIIRGFKTEELAEADEICKTPLDSQREDLTKLKTYSIDDETTRDIDDAFSLLIDEMGFSLYVHIADASFFVKPDTELDNRASNLGMSVYLPSGKISMFPPILSEGKMSLIQDEIRPALTFFTRFDNEFNIKEKKILTSHIKVDENISYTEADRRIEEGKDQNLSTLVDTVKKLREKRLSKGALEFLNPDYKVTVDNEQVKIKKQEANSPSVMLVKELMVLTGYQAASYCLVNNIPCVYISQDEPLEEISLESRVIPDIVEIFEIIRKLNKASLMTAPFRHYALGLDCYTQCTSPIRRYHDLIIQRQIKAHISGEPIPYSSEKIQKLSATSESFRQNLSIAEKEEKNYWIYRYLQLNKDNEYSCIILSQNRWEYRVFMEDFGIQSKVSAHSKLYVGDRIKVKVTQADPRAGILHIQCVAKKNSEKHL